MGAHPYPWCALVVEVGRFRAEADLATGEVLVSHRLGRTRSRWFANRTALDAAAFAVGRVVLSPRPADLDGATIADLERALQAEWARRSPGQRQDAVARARAAAADAGRDHPLARWAAAIAAAAERGGEPPADRRRSRRRTYTAAELAAVAQAAARGELPPERAAAIAERALAAHRPRLYARSAGRRAAVDLWRARQRAPRPRVATRRARESAAARAARRAFPRLAREYAEIAAALCASAHRAHKTAPRQFDALWLAAFARLPRAAIAERLGVSLPTAWQWVRRAYARVAPRASCDLIDWLDARGCAPPPWLPQYRALIEAGWRSLLPS